MPAWVQICSLFAGVNREHFAHKRFFGLDCAIDYARASLHISRYLAYTCDKGWRILTVMDNLHKLMYNHATHLL